MCVRARVPMRPSGYIIDKDYLPTSTSIVSVHVLIYILSGRKRRIVYVCLFVWGGGSSYQLYTCLICGRDAPCEGKNGTRKRLK